MEKERSTSTAAAEEFEYDDEEEKKMDRFYELIRRFNETRNHHQRSFLQFRHQNQPQFNHNNNNNNNNNNQAKKKNDVNINHNYKGSATDAHTTWMPSFKWEDFRQVLSHQHNQNQQENDQDQQVVVSSEKSAINFLQPHPEKSNFDDYNIHKLKKKNKRKMDDVNDGEITTADHYKRSSPRLDLNLAL